MQDAAIEEALAQVGRLSKQLQDQSAAASTSHASTEAFEQKVEAEVKERTKGALRKAMQLGQERVSLLASAPD